jgi:outer membrane protein OmpA-like peptidoglycan-associated protein
MFVKISFAKIGPMIDVIKDDTAGRARKQAYPYATPIKIAVAALAMQSFADSAAFAQAPPGRIMVDGSAQVLHGSFKVASQARNYKIIDGSAQALRPALESSELVNNPQQAPRSLNIFLKMAEEAPVAAKKAPKARAVVVAQQPAIYIAPSNVTRVWPVKPKVHQPIKRLVFSIDQLFESSSDKLTAAGEAKLATLAAQLRDDPDHPIVIVGHTDNLGFEQANKTFSLRCAERIRTWLVGRGLARSYAIEVRGAGGSEPFVTERLPGNRDNAPGRARNRRIEISIDPNKDVSALRAAAEADAEEKAAAIKGARAEAQAKMDRSLVESEGAQGGADAAGNNGMTMIPVTEDMLTQHLDPANTASQGSADHITNTAEWGTGGTDFGNNGAPTAAPGFGQPGGEQVNEEGKRVQRIPQRAEVMNKARQDTVEAQKEFGLFNGH